MPAVSMKSPVRVSSRAITAESASDGVCSASFSTCGSSVRMTGHPEESSTSEGTAAANASAAAAHARSMAAGCRCRSVGSFVRDTACTRGCTDTVSPDSVIMLCAASLRSAPRTAGGVPRGASRVRGMPSGAYQASMR